MEPSSGRPACGRRTRVALKDVKSSWKKTLLGLFFAGKKPAKGGNTAVAISPDVKAKISLNGKTMELQHGSVAIAAITSCTNTSNPSVMIGAGLVAKKAVEKGLTTAPWVKTSLAPGSKVVMEYLNKTGLTPYLEKLGFNLVGYGCTTCIGNSGLPLLGAADCGSRSTEFAGCGGCLERQPKLRRPD